MPMSTHLSMERIGSGPVPGGYQLCRRPVSGLVAKRLMYGVCSFDYVKYENLTAGQTSEVVGEIANERGLADMQDASGCRRLKVRQHASNQ